MPIASTAINTKRWTAAELRKLPAVERDAITALLPQAFGTQMVTALEFVAHVPWVLNEREPN